MFRFLHEYCRWFRRTAAAAPAGKGSTTSAWCREKWACPYPYLQASCFAQKLFLDSPIVCVELLNLGTNQYARTGSPLAWFNFHAFLIFFSALYPKMHLLHTHRFLKLKTWLKQTMNVFLCFIVGFSLLPYSHQQPENVFKTLTER